MREYAIPADTTRRIGAKGPDDFTFGTAAESPHDIAFRRGSEAAWRDVTGAKVVEVAKGLVGAGIKAGERVAMSTPPRHEGMLFDYTVWMRA